MILAVDIGNSNVVFGLYFQSKWQKIWRMNTVGEETLPHHKIMFSQRLLEANISPFDIKKIVLSSVVPDLTPHFEQFLREINSDSFILLNRHLYDRLPVTTSNPFEMGTDLMANALAAHELWKEDCIIVDFGTALTFTLVRASGVIEGVNIVPGLKTAARALSSNTAQLQEVYLEFPKEVMGKTTIGAIQNGIMIGYTGLVEHMISDIKGHYNPHCRTIATGGLAGILPGVTFDKTDKNLTLNGLRWIAKNIL